MSNAHPNNPAVRAACLAAAALGLLITPGVAGIDRAHAYDCAHGPDTYRVRGVADWDVLNMRSRPTARSRVVGTISPHGSGVHCLGPCRRDWCRVSWRGQVGWVKMRFLGE